ncbi:uncharacterized protein LAJ45_10781 [Morchella importuna]|uniref:uncharacterized protein n=1 Tax=Morchella importuna TaxID=1174673 RepID=UPI001E8E6F5A|nr:uncharacterized protein LAJ45_10781 [Morchella importuna]KAH8145220.1 hypothetical protein LAJ45_10781 [Morchella importuna]
MRCVKGSGTNQGAVKYKGKTGAKKTLTRILNINYYLYLYYQINLLLQQCLSPTQKLPAAVVSGSASLPTDTASGPMLGLAAAGSTASGRRHNIVTDRNIHSFNGA